MSFLLLCIYPNWLLYMVRVYMIFFLAAFAQEFLAWQGNMIPSWSELMDTCTGLTTVPFMVVSITLAYRLLWPQMWNMCHNRMLIWCSSQPCRVLSSNLIRFLTKTRHESHVLSSGIHGASSLEIVAALVQGQGTVKCF